MHHPKYTSEGILLLHENITYMYKCFRIYTGNAMMYVDFSNDETRRPCFYATLILSTLATCIASQYKHQFLNQLVFAHFLNKHLNTKCFVNTLSVYKLKLHKTSKPVSLVSARLVIGPTNAHAQ